MGTYELRYKIVDSYCDYIYMFLTNSTRKEFDFMILHLMTLVNLANKRQPDKNTTATWFFNDISIVMLGGSNYYNGQQIYSYLEKNFNLLKRFKVNERPFEGLLVESFEKALSDWIALTDRCEKCYREMIQYKEGNNK